MTPELNREGLQAAGRGLWWHRGRRFVTGVHVTAALVLALLAMALANYLSYHVYWRVNLSAHDLYQLSDRTRSLLGALDAEVNVVAFFQRNHALYNEVRNVLKEYDYAAVKSPKLKLNIEFVDPDRDLARVRELRQQYDLKDANVVVFECANRRRYVGAKDILEYDFSLSGREVVKKAIGFKAEPLFSSAIQSVTQSTWPVVYVLTGHGERDIDEGGPAGYSMLAKLLRRDNMDVKPLLLVSPGGVPADCSVLVVAGPDKRLSEGELHWLARYLEGNGRMLILLDPASQTGLEPLLQAWGVRVCPEAAVGLTLTGRELVVGQYGDHAMTRHLAKVVTMFNMPRVLEPNTPRSPALAQADQPKVTVLAANTDQGWAESDLSERPPRYEAGKDRPGPVPVALAVERGAVSGLNMEIKPTRMVVIGDSYFVSNAALESGAGGNLPFLMAAVNWLAEREALMAIPPKLPWELRLDMTRDQTLAVFLIVVVGIPGAVAGLGLMVWWKRRR